MHASSLLTSCSCVHLVLYTVLVLPRLLHLQAGCFALILDYLHNKIINAEQKEPDRMAR